MQDKDIAQVRAALMSELDWPVTSGEVQGAAEMVVDPQWRDEVVAATTRLPDDGHYLEIDELWAALDPLLRDVVHG